MKTNSIMPVQESTTSLFSSPVGEWIRIISLPPGDIRAQFIRLGLGEGERIFLLERLHGGTVVLQKRRQQIAIGHQLSRQIVVAVMVDQELVDD
jgi:Fe2+ transport system protein FeoA